VHNDYSYEVPPKFEIFSDQLEITSAGGLVSELSHEEFFEGYSIPRNKELMRIFKDLDMVEYLGSGVPRILQSYGRECFRVTDNFLRMTMPNAVIKDVEEGGQIGGSIQLTTRQKEILSLIEKDNQISKRQLAQILKINYCALAHPEMAQVIQGALFHHNEDWYDSDYAEELKDVVDELKDHIWKIFTSRVHWNCWQKI